ncbi:MAG: DUF1616 domain-containing protein [Actinomycetota bacterium]
MTTYITRDPSVGMPDEKPPHRAYTAPSLSSAITILVLGTVLALGGFFLPTGIRWVMWPLAMIVPGHAVVCAVFGHDLDFGGFRRAGLSAALTLICYPLIALTALVLGFRLTATVVSVGTFLLCAGCAAIVHRRERRDRAAPTVPVEPRVGRRLQVAELLVPGGAIVGSMLIVLASLQLFPRQPAEEFSVIALAGTWALTARAVPANPSRDVEVTYRIENRTGRVQEYEITAGIVDGPQWTGAAVAIEPGATWVGTTVGRALEDSCRSQLEIDMRVIGDAEDHFPLKIFLRDSTIDC